jgi:hypothetical protein
MATGLVASIGASTTFEYTAPANCKLLMTCTVFNTSQSITLNGVYLHYQWSGLTSQLHQQHTMFLASGQVITIVTPSQGNFIMSVYEE